MEAIAKRHSARAFRTDDLPLQDVSNILWAAAGHNRTYEGVGIHVEGCRSSPGAHNWQEIDIYVASAHGLHRYGPHRHELDKVLDQDIRALTSHPTQPVVPDSPLNLIYVSDTERMYDAIPLDYGLFPWADTAVMVENVYLYCASEGLAVVCRALFERTPLAEAMRLKPKQLITFSQLVGHKKTS